MPISAGDLTYLGKVSLDEYMRNMPVDQIAVETPLLKKLMSKRKLFLGAKQYVSGSVRKSHDSNFAWAYGDTAVGFNTRQTTDQFNYPWRRAVDGFYITHDTLFGAGIKVREGDRGAFKLEQNEKVQLFNLFEEQLDAFKTGFMQKLSVELHRNGTASTDAITGLDALVATSPATGVVGGIDRATSSYWRNNASTGLVSATANVLADAMELNWRKCIRNGGSSPDFILAGSAFIDAYRKYGISGITQNTDAGAIKRIDAGTGSGVSTGLYFKGVEIIWDPQFETLDALDAPVIPWEKRCYFLNTKHIELRDDDMDIVSPTRPTGVLALYQMINLRLALILKQPNAQAVLAIA